MYARGPGLKKNIVSKPLMMIDHYNLICHLLDVQAQPNNGSWIRVQSMLKDEIDEPFNSKVQSSAMTTMTSVSICLSLFILPYLFIK